MSKKKFRPCEIGRGIVFEYEEMTFFIEQIQHTSHALMLCNREGYIIGAAMGENAKEIEGYFDGI